jgi:hypothetical protein
VWWSLSTAEYKQQVEKALKEGTEGVEPHKDGVTALMVAALGGHSEVGARRDQALFPLWRSGVATCLPCAALVFKPAVGVRSHNGSSDPPVFTGYS